MKIENDIVVLNYQLSILNFQFNKGKFQSGQMELTVTQLSYDFGGSNPSLPTKKRDRALKLWCVLRK